MAVDDAKLVSRCLKGERRAYDALVKKYQAAAYGLAFSYAHNADDASDLVQDAFVSGYLNLEGLKERSRFGAWLKTILVNRARKQFRRKRKMVALAEASMALKDQAADLFVAREQQQELWDQISALDEMYRVPITLFYGSGLSYDEIAQFLDVPASTVRGRLQKAKRQLKDIMIEDLEMTPTDVSERVQDEICKIARAEIEETIDIGKHKHLALFLDVPASVKIVGGTGDQIVVRGHKVAVGKKEEDALHALQNIQLLHDEVDDWVAAGAHHGARFSGTTTSNNGRPEAIVGKSGKKITVFNNTAGRFFNYFYPRDVFPHLGLSSDVLDSIRQSLPKGACRFSAVFKEVLDVVLPQTALNDEVLEGLKVNHTNEDVAHGPSGRLTLEIALPSGIAVTIDGGDDVVIEDVSADVLCLHGQVGKVSNVGGNVFLLHTSAKQVEHVGGRLVLFDHSHPGGGTPGERVEAQRTQIENVAGDVLLNISYLDASLKGISGHIDVKNRIGNTDVEIAAWTKKKRDRVHTVSGDIKLKIKESLVDDVSIACTILAGSMNCQSLQDAVENIYGANNQRMRFFSTLAGSNNHYRDADVFLSSENGHLDVTIFE